MKGLRSIVPLPRESLRGLDPAKIAGNPPRLEWVDPRSLFVEENYQRKVGSKGVRLIRNIYAHFSWARYKHPVCVEMPEWDGARVCIDGQHTAIASACHPQLPKIPVMIVDAATAADRAGAFVGHNRDRVALTPVVIFHAELAAGDVLGQQVAEACRRSGAKVLEKMINLREKAPVGHTIAVGSLKNVAKRRGVDHLTRVLRVLVAAERGPIKAAEILAVDAILAGAGNVAAIDGRLQVVIASKTAEAWAAIGATAAAETGDPLGSAIATAWCRELDLRLSDGPGQAVLLRRKPPIDQKPGSDLVWKRPPPGSDLVEVSDDPEVLAALALEPDRRVSPKPAQIDTPGDRLDDYVRRQTEEARKPPRRDSPFRKPPPVTAEPRQHVEPDAPPPKPAPAPAVPAAPPPKPAPPPDSREVVTRNGVVLDLATRELRHRGKMVRVHRDDGARLVAALLRVMPALLDASRLAAKAFPKEGPADGPQRIKLLIDDVNPVLRTAQLEIRTMKVGSMLAVLG